LRANDFQEAFRIQIEYFQSQLKAAAKEATQIGAWMVGFANSPMLFLVDRCIPGSRRKTHQRRILSHAGGVFALKYIPTLGRPDIGLIDSMLHAGQRDASRAKKKAGQRTS
jgi:hypothetical protein